MLDASLEDITKFLACKRVALLGVSRKPQHFSRALLSEFLEKGYDAIPVNPHATEIAGHRCFAHVGEIAPPVEAVLLLTGESEVTNLALRECNEAGIALIWIYKRISNSEVHIQALEACQKRGAALIEGQCPFMYLPHPAFIHRAHRFVSKMVGSYPV